jgi:hypothetical protein
MLLLIIILLLLFGGGGGYYGYSRWGTGGGLWGSSGRSCSSRWSCTWSARCADGSRSTAGRCDVNTGTIR